MTLDRAALATALLEAWPGLAGREAQVRVARAPGRVNLIGEHTDYNDGFVLPAAIDRHVLIAWLPQPGRVDLVRLDTGERGGFALGEARPPDGSWLDYPAGVAAVLTAEGLTVGGLCGVIASDLPMNAGLSSSAAFELASAWALLGEAATTEAPLALARLAQRAENDYVGVQCGLMDQFASACGRLDSALLLDCRSLDWRPVRLPDDVTVVVCDTGSPRRLGASEYNLRRAQCEAAVVALSAADPSVRSLRDATVGMIDAAATAGTIDPVAERRARHIVAENERVHVAVTALESGDLEAVGRAFADSHASLRDLFEVSSPELDALVEIATAVPGVVASRMTGGGFGGCTVNLVRPQAVDGLRTAVERNYTARTGLTPAVLTVRAAVGAGLIDA